MAKNRSRSPSSSRSRSSSRSPTPQPRKKNLSGMDGAAKAVVNVSQLTRNVNEDHLEEIFGNYGKVLNVQLAIDPQVNLPKGYAYVEMEKLEDAEKCVEFLNGGQVDGNVVKVYMLDRKKAEEVAAAQVRKAALEAQQKKAAAAAKAAAKDKKKDRSPSPMSVSRSRSRSRTPRAKARPKAKAPARKAPARPRSHSSSSFTSSSMSDSASPVRRRPVKK